MGLEFFARLWPEHFGTYLAELVEALETGSDPGAFWAKWIDVVCESTKTKADGPEGLARGGPPTLTRAVLVRWDRMVLSFSMGACAKVVVVLARAGVRRWAPHGSGAPLSGSAIGRCGAADPTTDTSKSLRDA